VKSAGDRRKLVLRSLDHGLGRARLRLGTVVAFAAATEPAHIDQECRTRGRFTGLGHAPLSLCIVRLGLRVVASGQCDGPLSTQHLDP